MSKIDEIKKAMLEYRDLYGEPLINSGEIMSAKSAVELSSIIWQHASYILDCANDAAHSIEKFADNIGLTKLVQTEK